ncbi:hypothetical protein [Burkholderia gladioli]|uniref:hypothetical protein n=1 Tax=Burkholderia gladioli TaxID=28095 RepID=UPI0034568B11
MTAAELDRAVRALAARLVAVGVAPDMPEVLHLPRGALANHMARMTHAFPLAAPGATELKSGDRQPIAGGVGAPSSSTRRVLTKHCASTCTKRDRLQPSRMRPASETHDPKIWRLSFSAKCLIDKFHPYPPTNHKAAVWK